MGKPLDDEMQLFVDKIDLVEYAMAVGWELDEKESSKASKIMRHGSEKIVVGRVLGKGFQYLDVHDQENRGDIINFAQRHIGKNLGFVRKELRPWVGLAESSPSNSHLRRGDLPKVYTAPIRKADTWEMSVRWQERLEPLDRAYLRSRGLTDEVIGFASDELKSLPGNVTCLRHQDADGHTTGWEEKGVGHARFAAGGSKGLFMVHYPGARDVYRVIVTEAGVDALSYLELDGRPGDLAVSIGGGMSPDQIEQLRQLIDKPALKVVIATDPDRDGERYAEQIRSIRPDAERYQSRSGGDVNDDLKKTLGWDDGPFDRSPGEAVRATMEKAAAASRAMSITPSRELEQSR